jgi:hypothetical protein
LRKISGLDSGAKPTGAVYKDTKKGSRERARQGFSHHGDELHLV